MKYAIFADIHANLEALHAVLVDAKSQGCTRYACLGDIVGYNADPKECLDIVRGMEMPCVKGNYDEYCSSDVALDGFNPKAAEAVEWTRQQLTEEDRRWLRELPLVAEVDGFTIVHAMLDAPARWGYVFDKLAAATSFNHQSTPICFFGHTHVPVAFVRDSMVRGGTYSKFKIEAGKQYFVNPGAVGQPRDGNSKAAYVVYDRNQQTVELRRVDYDIPGAEGKIKAAGLPPRLA
ncbi:MAG: metallophosphoesterase [Verrucomicrobia bacterium]|nr:MAG: metallophosphoesterase [Verrucomicrobiota bacterium]